MKKMLCVLSFSMVLFSCSHEVNRERNPKVVIDKSPSMPEWVKETNVNQLDGDQIYLVGRESIKGDQRLSGCFEMASFELKNKIIREVGEEIRGTIDQAIPDISENSEAVLSRVSTGKWTGKLVGLSTDSEYFERYRLFDFNQADSYKERIDCFVRMKIAKSDINRMKRDIIEELKKVDPKIKEAILNKQVNFFSKE